MSTLSATVGTTNAVVARRSRPSKDAAAARCSTRADGYPCATELATCRHDRRHALIVTTRAPKYLSSSPRRSISGPTESRYQPIHRQRDPNCVGNVETNRTQLNHDATIDEHNPLDTMRLQVIKPNNITSA